MNVSEEARFTVTSTSGSKYMGNVHANTEAVPFDFESAEALTMRFKHLTQTNQMFTR